MYMDNTAPALSDPSPSPPGHRDSTSDSHSQFHRRENVIFFIGPNFLKKTFLLREKFLFTFLKTAYNFKRLEKNRRGKAYEATLFP